MTARGADVVVIGSGVVGMSVALHLRWLGVSVVVLERDRVGDGSSTRGSGTVSTLDRGAAARLRLMLAAQAYYPEFLERIGRPDAYRVTGATLLIRDEVELESLGHLVNEHREVAGYEQPTILDVATLRDLEPAITGPVAGAVHRAADAQVEPAVLVEALHAAVLRSGATIVEGARVDAVTRSHGEWRLATAAGSLGCRAVVNCAGVWAEQLGRLAGVDIPVRAVRGQVVVVESGGPRVRGSVTSTARLDVRQAVDGRYWLGTVQQVDSWDLGARAADTTAILERVAAMFAGIADRPISAVWAGLRPSPADGLPLVGRLPATDDFYVAVGNDGLSLCGVEGRALAAQIAGAPVDPLLAPFDPARPIAGWQAPESDMAASAAHLLTNASRLAMRTDATDWSRVGTVASRSAAASKHVADASQGRPLPSRPPEWP